MALNEAADTEVLERRVFDQGLLCQLTVRVPTFSKKLDSKQMAAGGSIDPKFIRGTKSLIPTTALGDIRSVINEARTWLRDHSLSFLFRGATFIPRNLIGPTVEKLEALKDKFDEAVDDIITRYPDYKEAAKASLKVLYSEADYPSAESLRETFGFTFHLFSISPPTAEAASMLSIEDKTKQLDRYDLMITNFKVSAVEQVRERVAALLDKLAHQLVGDGARFHTTALQNLRDLLLNFADLYSDDEALKTTATQLQELVADKTAGDIRKDEELRSSIGSGIMGLASSLSQAGVEDQGEEENLPTPPEALSTNKKTIAQIAAQALAAQAPAAQA